MDGSLRPTLTVKISNIPVSVNAQQLLTFLESLLGKGSIFAIDIFTERKNWKSKGHGRVQFEESDTKIRALSLSDQKKLLFKGFHLSISHALEEIIIRPVEPRNRVEVAEGLVLVAGVMVKGDCLGILESWDGIKLWYMPERKKLEIFVSTKEGECFKMDVGFGDIWESNLCYMDGREDKSILLKLKHAPKIFKKVSGPDIASRFSKDRFHICKEDFNFVWVRTTDFSKLKSIGYLSCLCWEIEEESSDIYASLPYYEKEIMELALEEVKFNPTSSLVPIVSNKPGVQLPYEVLFQLSSLVHTQKLSLAAVDSDLFNCLSKLSTNTAMSVLGKMHKLTSTCYSPLLFIKKHSQAVDGKNLISETPKKLKDHIMTCHRVLVTPSKIFCLGPELENSNYIVQNFKEYASDFLRVTFVDEDWGRIPAHAVSVSIKSGICPKPQKTELYQRIISILRDGIVIGEKKFEFLSFSASQLRSNAVWMFASNEHVRVEDIREWMGQFSNIRNVSKCAARMGQLFSSSKQTLEVQPRDVALIPDIEVTVDGVNYCFSDGIGKISFAFAKEISRKLGLSHIPSAFQIRYGGYKGVIAVDRNIYRKLALRPSMRKFESNNYMLNITKSSESMPCYLNREIIGLLSSLGVDDEIFLNLQEEQLQHLALILTSTDSAVTVLESTGISEMKSIVGRMLLQGYEPTKEPYLLAMLQSHFQNQLSDLRSRCRVFVPKGRVLVGCLDETGILEYGQVYVRITLNKSENVAVVEGKESTFRMVDEKTAVVLGKVVVTKNPCLHPGDVRVLEAVWDPKLQENSMVDCLVFPQKGNRPHPNECSGGDLDGDQYFISWDKNLIPPLTVPPMDYTGRRPRITDHIVTLEEIHRFFADYIISDTLGSISTTHLVHADHEPEKALSAKCLELANLHSMAVDFAKTGAPADMPNYLKLREYPDFMERYEKPMYISQGPLGKLYRSAMEFMHETNSNCNITHMKICDAYDSELVVDGYEEFVTVAENQKEKYGDEMETLMKYYGAESEVEILTGDLKKKSGYLLYDKRRYGEVKDRILVSVKSLMKEVKRWFESNCNGDDEERKCASAWYFVTYHPIYMHDSKKCLGFPWVVGNILMDIKSGQSVSIVDEN